MSRKIEELAKKYRIEDPQEVDLIKRALNQNNDSIIEDIFAPKKWKEFKAEYEKMKSEPTLYFRYPFKPLPPANSQSKSVKCITIGPCGSGKTSFINLLCGSDLPSGSSSSSLTRNVTQVESLQKYQIPLVLYDTPGTTAHQDKLMHAVLVRQLLQYTPVNCVMILVKYENRTDELLSKIYGQVKMLPGYEKNILFLITHFDLASKNPQQEIATIETLMKELLPQFTNQMIFFSNQTVEQKQLSDTIYNIARSYDKVNIKIDDKTFFKYFNLQKSQLQQLFFQAQEKQIFKEMDDATDDYIGYAKALPDDNQREAIFQDIEVVLKNQLLSLLDDYSEKYKQTILTYEYYESFYNLQLRKNENLTRYKDQIRSLRKLDKFIQSEASGSKLDIRDLIKQCPRCHLIWFRIQACPNTSCGSRPSCIFDYIKKPISRFKIFRDKKTKKVIVSKAQTQEDFHYLGITKGKKFVNVNASTLTVETKSGDKSIKQRMQTGKALGCGQAMNFQTLPRIQKIDEKLMEWYGTHTIEEVIQMFQKDEDLQRTRREVQKKARESFFGFRFFD